MREGRPTSSTPEGSPIARRRRVEVLGEVRAQRGGAWESGPRCDVLNRQGRGFEQFACALETHLQQPAVGEAPGFGGEGRDKGRPAEGGRGGGWGQVKGRAQLTESQA